MNPEAPLVVITVAILTSIIGPVAVFYFKEWRQKKNSKDPLSESLKINSLITDKLDTIKNEIESDRIWLIQFHNGGHFYPTGKSIQKFSMVYELINPGMVSCQHQFQNIPASLFSKTINELYNGNIIKVEDLEKNPHNYGLTNVIAESGTKSTYIFPVVSIKDEFVGIVGIDYMREKTSLNDNQLINVELEIATIGGELMKYLKS